MKIMFKIKQISACTGFAALLMAGALLNTACSSDEAIVENKPAVEEKTTPTETTVKFIATLAPKGDNGSGTRNITVNNQGSANETLNVAWKKDEHIAIYYQKNDDIYATVMATVGEPNSDGSAPITANLTNAKGGEAKFVYPYTLHDNAGGIKTSMFTGQKGTLADISTNFDAATATGTIAVSGDVASISGKLTMQNRVCICKFKFQELVTFNDGANYYDVRVNVKKDGTTRSFQASNVPKASMGEVYMAILGTSDSECKFVVTGWYKSSPDDPSAAQKSSYNCTYNNVNLVAGTFYRNVPVTLDYNWNSVNLSSLTGDYVAQDGNVLTGTLPSAYHLSIAAGASVTLDGVTISANSKPGITCNGDATIILEGTNNVSATNNPAIQAGPTGKTLTIKGDGSLTATGGDNAAGIGSGNHGSCGNITISGGTIEATGGTLAAGIGSGHYGSCGDITISGGTVTATGGDTAAGIGSGSEGQCGDITITTGVTKVTASKGNYAPYSIGKGALSDVCGTITIGGTSHGTNGCSYSPYIYQPTH